MKIIAKLLLFVFVSFLITPLISSIIDRDKDISTFYSFSTEEKIQKKIIAIISFEAISATANLSPLNCKLIFSKTCPITIKFPRKHLFHHPNKFNHFDFNFSKSIHS